jgi:phage terminase Nu1 subunit (DNA packaging protein)
MREKFEYQKGVIRLRKVKDRQCNGQEEKKRQNDKKYIQSTTQNTRLRAPQTQLKTEVNAGDSCSTSHTRHVTVKLRATQTQLKTEVNSGDSCSTSHTRHVTVNHTNII